MEVNTMDMSKAEAARELRTVRRLLEKREDPEYRRLETAYRAMARGRKLLSLREVFEWNGFNTEFHDGLLPQLAIGRADRKMVALLQSQRMVFSTHLGNVRPGWGRTDQIPSGYRGSLVVPVGIDRPRMSDSNYRFERYPTRYSLVPMVPPRIRADIGRASLRNHHIIWEVDVWWESPLHTEPDIDPILVRMIDGDLCEIVAQWDLTPLERAVMLGRRVQ